VEPQGSVDAMRQQIARDPASRDPHVETPQSRSALGEVFGNGPVLKELRAIMIDASEPPLVDELLGEHHRGHAPIIVPDHVRNLGPLDRFRHLADSAALRPSGFSHMTILPAAAAASAISVCVSLGAAISTRSISLRSTSLRQSGSNVA